MVAPSKFEILLQRLHLERFRTLAKRSLFIVIGLSLFVFLTIIGRTLNHKPQSYVGVTLTDIVIDESRAATNLAAAIRFKTITHQSSQDFQDQPFVEFINWVKLTYPEVREAMGFELFAHTMLYRWQGSDQNLKPILLTGHYDVVPVTPSTLSNWQEPPFAGTITQGKIWGRGAIDNKNAVIGILEAATHLLNQGYQPKRTIYFSFGHDEENGGANGAAAVVAHLRETGVQFAWSLDEGSFVFDGVVAGVEPNAAIINVAEKGYVVLQIVAKGTGGHAAIPPKETSIGTLARAITKLEENPMPAGLDGVNLQTFDILSRHMGFGSKIVFANRWLLGRVAQDILTSNDLTNAFLRTTTAPTMLSGSPKENVLASEAVVTINYRMHPRDTIDDLMQHVKSVVEDPNIEVLLVRGREASPVSSWESAGYNVIRKSVREIYGDIVVAPGLMVAGSDSAHYGKIADNAYRFNPFMITSEGLASFHNTNENIDVENFLQGIRTYIQLIRNGSM